MYVCMYLVLLNEFKSVVLKFDCSLVLGIDSHHNMSNCYVIFWGVKIMKE